MKLRTLEGRRANGEMVTEYPISPDGSPVLVVNGEPYGPEEAEFLLESATSKELKLLERGGYDLSSWGSNEENEEFMDDDYLDEDELDEESEDD